MAFILSLSCSSKKNLLYLQDIENVENIKSRSYYSISPGDILKITLMTSSPQIVNSLIENNTSSFSQNRESLMFEGYPVDDEGFINYPQIGKIYVTGLSLDDLKNLIYSKLVKNNILVNPVIDIKILNWTFTVLGEVNKPGKYFFDNPNLNLLEALGIAGDLTIHGERGDIKIIREKESKVEVYNIDLTKKDFIDSDFYTVVSGDIIIVNPNSSRAKNAGLIGNAGNLLSLFSFLLSSIILIFR